MSNKPFVEAVNSGMLTGDWTALESWITQESSFTFDYGATPEDETFSDEVFESIVALLKKQEFLSSEGSFNVLRILEYDWSLLSDSQKLAVLPVLEAAYSKFKDPMSWFIISELLGEYAGDEKALQSLCRLKKTDLEEPRSLVPMGLAHIARQSHDKSLSEKAYVELARMRNDPSEQVRQEVEMFLQRVEGARQENQPARKNNKHKE